MNSNPKIKYSSGREWEILPEKQRLSELCFKIVIIGNSGVGKSCLVEKASHYTYNEQYTATIGFEFLTYSLKHDNDIVKLQIWDTCGQERYRSLITNFYRNASLAIIVYSIDNHKSFEKVDDWIKDLRIYSSIDTLIVLVGNKVDLTDERKVSKEEGEEYSKKYFVNYFFETSAKTGENVHNIFVEVAKELFDNHLKYERVIQLRKEITKIKSNDIFDTSSKSTTISNRVEEKTLPYNCYC